MGGECLALFLCALPLSAQAHKSVQPALICSADNSCITLDEWMKSTASFKGDIPMEVVPEQGYGLAKPDASGLFGVRPAVRVKLTNGSQTWYQDLPVTKPTANRTYWIATGLSGLLTVLDIENSHLALNRPGTSEANPLFGAHPGRARYYGICLPIFALNAYMSYRYKRQDQALADAGIQGHKYVKWWLPEALNGGMHAIGLAVTLGATGR